MTQFVREHGHHLFLGEPLKRRCPLARPRLNRTPPKATEMAGRQLSSTVRNPATVRAGRTACVGAASMQFRLEAKRMSANFAEYGTNSAGLRIDPVAQTTGAK